MVMENTASGRLRLASLAGMNMNSVTTKENAKAVKNQVYFERKQKNNFITSHKSLQTNIETFYSRFLILQIIMVC